MYNPACAVCGGEGANQAWSDNIDGSNGSMYHLICLARHRMGIEETHLRFPRSAARGYLAALIDGEGHVRKDSGSTEIVNNDLTILAAARVAARLLGIRTRLRLHGVREGYKPTYALSLLGGAETRNKLMRLPIVCKYKRRSLGRK